MTDFGPRWERIDDLPEGGQAHAFKVRDKIAADGKTYVLKRLKNPKRTDRFDQEIKACQSLDHPNILKIEDFGIVPGKDKKPFFVSDWCELGSLADRTMPHGSLLEAVTLFRHICAGIAHAHANGIVHRDVKPENVFLRTNGVPVVGDFGICLMESNEDGRLTETLEVAGSRWYCAPELRNGRLETGISQTPADVYSLGKLL
jgi:serine/threonine protein kinase